MKQLAIIRFWYEGNAFSPVTATSKAFQNREWIAGPGARAFYKDTSVELAAVDDFLENNADIEAHYIFCTAAYPAGPMEASLFEEILNNIVTGLGARQWHGIYLSLHGSAVASDEPRTETTLLRRVRGVVGPSVPIAATFDLHANLNPEIAALVDIVCGYKTYPHIDMRETAYKALTILGKAMAKEISPLTAIVPAGFAPTSFNMCTGQNPMAEMMSRAGLLEKEKHYFDVSVFGGFVYADTVDAGASISICASLDAGSDASRLARMLRMKAPQFESRLPAAREVLSGFKQTGGGQPVAFLEASDNIFSGGGADTPGLLRAVIDARIDAPVLFAFFHDPEIVQAGIKAGAGNFMDCKIGGRLTTQFGSPVELTAQVVRLTDGKFVNAGPMEKNLEVNLGPTAVLKSDNLTIVITSECIPVNDKAWFDLHDLELNDFAGVCVKAKNHFRAAFEGHFSKIIAVETPGPAASDLSSLSFKNIPESMLKIPVHTRLASTDDTSAIAAIHAASWRDVYKNILPRTYLDNEIEQERNRFWQEKINQLPEDEMVLTIDSGERVLGFIWTTSTGEPGYDSVIEALHIDPDCKGCGHGKRLMKAAVKRLIEQGKKSVCLRVFDDNLPAIAFYQHVGGVKDHSGIDNFAGANAADSRIGWKDINQLLDKLG